MTSGSDYSDTRSRSVCLSRVPAKSSLRVSESAYSLVSSSAVCRVQLRAYRTRSALVATDRFEIQEYKCTVW